MMNQPTWPSNLAIFMGIPGSMHQGQMSLYSDRSYLVGKGRNASPECRVPLPGCSGLLLLNS